MSKDLNKEKPFKRAVLRDRNGDLTKEWYVEYYAWEDLKNDLVRKRIKIALSFQTKKARIHEANKIISGINEVLEKGYYYKSVEIQLEESVVEELKEIDLIILLEQVLSTIAPTLKPKSVITYRSAINKLKLYAVDKVLSINAFTHKDVVQFRDFLISNLGNTSRTANNTIIHLGTIYAHLKEREVVPDSPFKIKKLKQEVTSKNIAFTDQDRKRIEKYMEVYEPELYLFTRFIYFAFIRPGELRSMKANDVKVEEKYIIVRGAISKNGKTETVPIIKPLFALLSKQKMNERSPFVYLFGKGLIPCREVTGKQVAFRRHEKLLKTLKLDSKGYTLYSWKHTGAVNAYLSGVGIKQLQMFLRHSTIQMTDIYLKSLGLRTDPNIENYNW